MTAILIASETHVAGVLARPIGILLKTEGAAGTLLRCRLSVTEKCVIPANCETFQTSPDQSTLAAICAWSQTSFPAEDLGEMAGICITDIESDFYYTLLCFTQQLSRSIDSQINLVPRW